MIKLPKPTWLGDIYGHSDATLKQAVRDALTEAWSVDWFELLRDGHLITRDAAATLSDRVETKLDALIKEIPE